jgi:hypothetical protein
MRRALATALAAVQIAGTIVFAQVATMRPALAVTYACNAGKDGAGGTLSGVYNTYYQPPLGSATAGSTTLALGTIDTAGGGSGTAVTSGDELLVIQMQAGTLNDVNSSSYGLASVGNAGLYEYVQVASVAGSTATIVGGGTGGGLINTYTEAAATASSGQQRYQIVRVPQYVTATLSSTFHAAYWDGSTGGVAALDIASTLNLGGASIYATGNGFRGAGVSVATTSPTSVLNSDWVDSATMNGTPSSNPPSQGFKGEGILGTPAFTFGYTNFTTPATPTGPTVNKGTADGYPGGDVARGAPGNAGGGGTDADPASNDQNTGGGGGANGGAGGNGGYPWTPNEPDYPLDNPGAHTATGYAAAGPNNNPDIGGRGATALTPSATRLFMGGGGGGGSNNNGSENNTYNADGSSGGTGGGIVMMRIANTSGAAATVYADGTTGLAPDNDGGGGGGAGGTVEITSPNTFSGITVYARGAAGTSAYNKSGDTSSTTQHGPGGGGGGGVVLTSSPVTADMSGGANGTTLYGVNNAYGATSGASGTTATISAASIPGAPSGAECPGTTGQGYIGPVDTSEATYGGADETGSYDGVVAVGNNNDFTARSFVPSGATFTNSGTVAGTPVGNTLSGTTTVSVPNKMYYNNTTNKAVTVTLTGSAPTSAWSMQLCPSNGAAADCSGATTTPFSPSTAGSTTSATFSVAKLTVYATTIWASYSVPAGTTAFTRYDAVIGLNDSSTVNYTHNELYAGFIPVTKTTTVVSSGCPSGETPGASGICPGGVLQYKLDYRDIMAGAGLGTEGQLLSAFLATAAGQLAITDNGSASGSNWASNTNGLKEALTNNLGTGNSACGITAGTCGDSTAGTTFTGNTAGSTSFTATIGGLSFQLVPSGITGGTSQGSITFAVVIK